MMTPDTVRAAIVRHETIYFDAALSPVAPAVGQWFCEFDIELAEEGNEVLRDGALVEYLGQATFWNMAGSADEDIVCEEYADDIRRPRGDVLILQA